MVLLKTDPGEDGRLLEQAKRNLDQRWRSKPLRWRLALPFGLLAFIWAWGILALFEGRHHWFVVTFVLSLVTIQAMAKMVTLLRRDPERLYDDFMTLAPPWLAIYLMMSWPLR
jgi:hypothetical protein